MKRILFLSLFLILLLFSCKTCQKRVTQKVIGKAAVTASKEGKTEAIEIVLKDGTEIATKRTMDGGAKILYTAGIAAGVTLITDDALNEVFKNVDKDRKIEAYLSNKEARDLLIPYTTDGKKWKEKKIEGGNTESITSDRGLIGIDTGRDKYLIQDSDVIILQENNGKLEIHASKDQ